MTATIAIAALVVVAGALGLAAYMARNATAATKTALDDRARTADTLFDLATAHGEIERAELALAAATAALTAEKERTAALERSLIDAIENDDLGAGLAADDVRGRVLRIVEDWKADAARREVPAVGAGPVLDPSATDTPDAGAVPG